MLSKKYDETADQLNIKATRFNRVNYWLRFETNKYILYYIIFVKVICLKQHTDLTFLTLANLCLRFTQQLCFNLLIQVFI